MQVNYWHRLAYHVSINSMVWFLSTTIHHHRKWILIRHNFGAVCGSCKPPHPPVVAPPGLTQFTVHCFKNSILRVICWPGTKQPEETATRWIGESVYKSSPKRFKGNFHLALETWKNMNLIWLCSIQKRNMKSNHYWRNNKYWWRGLNFQLPGTSCPTFCFKCSLGKLQSPNKMVHVCFPALCSKLIFQDPMSRLTLAKVRIYWANTRCHDFLLVKGVLDPNPPLLSPFPLRWQKKAHHWRYSNWWYFVSGQKLKKHSQVEKKQATKKKETDLQLVCRPRKNHVQCKPCLP